MASTDVAGVIPTSTQSKIFDLIKQDAPLLGEITLFQVPGNLTVSVEGTNADAAIHSQNTLISPAADTMNSVTLGGFEIVKVNRISATVSAMAIAAFEQWLVMNLSRKMSRKMAYYCIYGTGSSQPKGIDYMDTWTDTSNSVQWAGAAPTAAEYVEMISYLKGGYTDNAKMLMNSQTLWGKIVPIQDNSKFKILNDDYTRLLGFPILLDDNVAANDVFFGNFREGMIGNISAPIRVESSAASGFLYNAIDYRATTLFDCDLTHTEGFVKCSNAVAV
jgi:HK97 family phage major capsid protein